MQSGKVNAGYNALTDEIVEDMLAAGIVDPVKMPRMALENAMLRGGASSHHQSGDCRHPRTEVSSASGGGDMGGMGY